MCGIFFAHSNNQNTLAAIKDNLTAVEYTLRFRGPDATNVFEMDHTIAMHTILSITGDGKQPFALPDGYGLYNGEIYNDWQNYSPSYSDSDYLQRRLKEDGMDCLHGLDGEFAIILYNQARNTVTFVTDYFTTKPLYYAIHDGALVAGSYDVTCTAALPSAKPLQLNANTILTISLVDYSIISEETLHHFDFENANTDHYDDFTKAFQKAIQKRSKTAQHPIFVPLSSGHDSGLIAAELMHQGVKFASYAMPYGEKAEILAARKALMAEQGLDFVELDPSPAEWDAFEAEVKQDAPYYAIEYAGTPDVKYPDPDVRTIGGFLGSAYISKLAKSNGQLILMSGQGADEIISDYYNEFSNSRRSCLKGDWTKANKPWVNFNAGWNQVLLGGNERMNGHFGVESRYPFLDRDLIQAFLNLTPELKGKRYKAPITQMLDQLNYPYHDYKIGFYGFDQNARKASA